MSRFLKGFLVFLFAMALFAGSRASARQMLKIQDMAGREVTVPYDPNRIICIAPGTLRLVIYLKAKDKVVGVEDIEKKFPRMRPYWMATSELGRLPSIGPGGPNAIDREPDLEKVLAVRPDVIFITYMERETADALQKKIGIPVVVLSYGPFGTFSPLVYDSLRVVGKILGREERSQAVVHYIKDAQRDLMSRVKGYPDKKKPTVYVGGVGFKGTHGIESTETIYPPFDWIQARNVAFSQDKEGHFFIDKERLLSWNPEMIFLDSGGSGIIRQDYQKKPEFYRALRAFRNRAVYTLYSFNWYMTNIGTVIADAYAAGKILYPDRFADIHPDAKADDIYTYLVGRALYRKMEEVHGPLGGVPSFLK
jgi:iron complex transport system substrate-binding protein